MVAGGVHLVWEWCPSFNMQSLGHNPSDHELNHMVTAVVSGTDYLITVARRLVLLSMEIHEH